MFNYSNLSKWYGIPGRYRGSQLGCVAMQPRPNNTDLSAALLRQAGQEDANERPYREAAQGV